MIENDHLRIIETTNLDEKTKGWLLDLWNSEYPENLSYRDLAAFNEYLKGLNDVRHLLVMNEENNIEGWAFSFDRDGERWFAIILSQNLQGRGVGRKILDQLKLTESELNGWVTDHDRDKKINGSVYNSPLGFYQKCDFEIMKTERLELDKISAVKIKWMNRG
jgi:GNAT superfamily N-acetyltransferase